MRPIDSQEDNNPAIELLSDLRIPEQKRVLESVQEIRDALELIKKKVISTGDVIKPLITIDRHIGHYHVQPLLESFGIQVNDSIVSIASQEQVTQRLNELKSHIFQREANEPRPTVFITPPTKEMKAIFTKREAITGQVQEVLT